MIWNLLWKVKKFDSSEQIVDNIQDTQDDQLSHYYQCIVECDLEQHVCKRRCKHLLLT